MYFTTHAGETVSGPKLVAALNNVADDWERLALAIKNENAYAEHVTDEQKETAFREMLECAKGIREGQINSFTIWQRVNAALTGQCVALLP